MTTRYSTQYEICDDFSAQVAEELVGQSFEKLRTNFWPVFRNLSICTGLSGLLFLVGSTTEKSNLENLLTAGLLIVFGGLLSLVLIGQGAALLLATFARRRFRRMMMDPFLSVDDRTVRWVFGEEKFEVYSAIGNREVAWNQIRLFRTGKQFWILGILDGPDLILPVESLTEELREFVRLKAGVSTGSITSRI